jgi:hypothetical protein
MIKALWHFEHTDLFVSAMRSQKSHNCILLSLALLYLLAEEKRVRAVILPTGYGVRSHRIKEQSSSFAFGIAALIISYIIIYLISPLNLSIQLIAALRLIFSFDFNSFHVTT